MFLKMGCEKNASFYVNVLSYDKFMYVFLLIGNKNNLSM